MVFVLEPVSTTVAQNEPTEIKCSAYVSANEPELSLKWTIAGTTTSVDSSDGFSVRNETLVAGGIQFVTTALIFSGSSSVVTHSLSCTASVSVHSFSRNFALAVVEESGNPIVCVKCWNL